MSNKNNVIEQGWAARPFAEQFPELPERDAKLFDDINRAITLLSVHGMMTPSQMENIRGKKFTNLIRRKVKDARGEV